MRHHIHFSMWFSFFFFLFAISWAALVAYEGSQARGWIGAIAAGLHQPEPQQCGIQAASATYTTAHGNAGSLTHWARPGIESEISWFLVGFISTEPWRDLQKDIFKMCILLLLSLYVSQFSKVNFIIHSGNILCTYYIPGPGQSTGNIQASERT